MVIKVHDNQSFSKTQLVNTNMTMTTADRNLASTNRWRGEMTMTTTDRNLASTNRWRGEMTMTQPIEI